MLSNYFIEKYKSLRKQSYLDKLVSYRHQYAFIGAGDHSIGNLYPCIRQLNIPLRYICTKDPRNAERMAAGFAGCTGTSDLKLLLEDPAVKGVFVCTRPSLHPELTRQLLSAGKSVFVEKPPAFSREGLEELIAVQGQQTCMPGLQRRFSTINGLLKKARIGAANYTYRYVTGPYPEGNPIYELFIHPVDNALSLFGSAHVAQIVPGGLGNGAITYFLHLEHTNGAKGMLELSTAHSWSAARELLEINTAKETLLADYPFRLTGLDKPAVIGGIPMEKLFHQPRHQKIYFENTGFIPVAANNSLVSQGFFGEIDHFVRLVEKDSTDDYGRLSSLRNTYEILDRLQSAR